MSESDFAIDVISKNKEQLQKTLNTWNKTLNEYKIKKNKIIMIVMMMVEIK